MLFNSWVFAVFFLLVYPTYRVLGHTHQNRLLLVASWVFYGWWDIRFLALLLLTCAVDWGVGRLLETAQDTRRKALIAASIILNLGVLAVFKYLGFFVEQAEALATLAGLSLTIPTLKIILPVGISFYTFQSMSYTIDVYRKKTPIVQSFWDFALFVSFFPQLVAGPIERSNKLLPQLLQPRTITPDKMSLGAWFMLWGFAKKILIADNLATITETAFDAPTIPSGLSAISAAYAFTFQIYCDFSGYSDIARGLALWLGVDLMENFRRPFLAASPRELWRRWHISLSEWLRDYLYIPLGGNKGISKLSTVRNLMITMLLGGFWHGANWTYLIWGGLHGAALSVQHLIGWEPKSRPARIAGILATFHLTVIAFIFFRSDSLGRALDFLGALSHWNIDQEGALRWRQLGVLAVPLLTIEAIWEWRPQSWRIPWPVQAIGAAALFWLTMVLGASFGQQFIYFQF